MVTTCGNTTTAQLLLLVVAVAVAVVSLSTALPVSEPSGSRTELNITAVQKNLKCSVNALFAVTKPSSLVSAVFLD